MRPLSDFMGCNAILKDRNAIVWSRYAKAVGSYRNGRGIHRILCDRDGIVWSSNRSPWECNGIVWCRYGANVGSYETAWDRHV